jgi:hypothetical protein
MRILSQSLIVAITIVFSLTSSQARDISVATWNLGWHLNLAEARSWIAACSQPFALNTASGLWEPSTTGSTKSVWELTSEQGAKFNWDISLMPPCNVFKVGKKTVPVTETAYINRLGQIRTLISTGVNTDIIAFQEVSGVQSVQEILPNNGADYNLCGFTGYKVQRLVIAAKKSLGQLIDCKDEVSLSLPQSPAKEQPRPGLAATVTIDGKPLRIMTVHLKSRCVSPLEKDVNNPAKGQLDGSNEHCVILQRQVAPLEAWIESQGTVPMIIMGDFNRNLPHEMNSIAPPQVRVDGSDPTSPLSSTTKVRSLLGEVNDGSPAASSLSLLDAICQANLDPADFCRRFKTEFFDQDILKPLTEAKSLGCSLSIGLDHVLMSKVIAAGAKAEKVPIGALGITVPGTPARPDPQLAVSDHCPLKATVTLP